MPSKFSLKLAHPGTRKRDSLKASQYQELEGSRRQPVNTFLEPANGESPSLTEKRIQFVPMEIKRAAGAKMKDTPLARTAESLPYLVQSNAILSSLPKPELSGRSMEAEIEHRVGVSKRRTRPLRQIEVELLTGGNIEVQVGYRVLGRFQQPQNVLHAGPVPDSRFPGRPQRSPHFTR